ncbi:MAG: DNA polymerase Y family protein [Burkholderiales bacterium]
MLWVACVFPRLARAALPGLASPEPSDAAGRRGMLEAAAMWLCQFTPRVSLEPPRGVLAEVEASLRLFGGARALLRRLRAGLRELGFEDASVAMARTPRAALWRAAGGGGRLERLPLEVAGLDADALDFLHGIGARSIGDVAKLPRAGLARRVAPALLDALDQAKGNKPEPRSFFAPPARFVAALELPAEVAEAQALLFAARRLLVQLEGFLAACHAGVRGFTLTLEQRSAVRTQIVVGLAGPARDAAHFTLLLRERLGAIVLADAVEAIRLEAGDITPLAGRSGDFFGDANADAEGWLRLLERLRARLGERAVHGVAPHPEHRPELAWRAVQPGAQVARAGAPAAPRPLWLLDPPRRLREGECALLAGPERIESGWWDGAGVRRDYFLAHAADGALVWIYRDAQGWFLHGIFA